MQFPLRRAPLRSLALAAAPMLVAPVSGAQTDISGAISDGNGGPLLADQVYHAVGQLSLLSGETLTIQSGAILKFTDPSFAFGVSGSLLANGTPSDPVIFTSIQDSVAAGGSTQGAPGDWRGLIFLPGSDASVLNHAEVRFAGSGNNAAVDLAGGGVTLNDCRIRDGLADAFDVGGVSAVGVSGCSFDDNGGRAVDAVPLAAVPGFVNNAASGNAGGDFMRVIQTNLAADLTVGLQNVLNDALVLGQSLLVPAGVTLTVEQGVVFKTTFATQSVTVNGALQLLGTAFEPVVFTAFEDDAFGGDTGGDGAASAPAPGSWRGITYAAGAQASLLENVRVRFAGQGGTDGLGSTSPLVTVRSVRVEHCAADGISLGEHAGPAANLVAFDCGSHGIELTGGSFDLVHATSAANGQAGVRRSGSYAGQVRSSISSGNAGANFDGFAAGEVVFSNGSPDLAGVDGNIDADPLFADPSPAAGDLTLQAGSPCLNTAELATALGVVVDHAENSRLLDHDLSGTLLPDMGAFERAVWTTSVAGEPSPGELLTFTTEGPAGLSVYLLGFLDGALLIDPFGFLTAGTLSVIDLGAVPVGTPFPLPIPAAASLVGVAFGVQTGTVPLSSFAVGNATNLYRATVRP